MTQYDGTVADVAQEVGQALASVQTIIKHMLNKDVFAHLSTSCADELEVLERAVRVLAPAE